MKRREHTTIKMWSFEVKDPIERILKMNGDIPPPEKKQ